MDMEAYRKSVIETFLLHLVVTGQGGRGHTKTKCYVCYVWREDKMKCHDYEHAWRVYGAFWP